MNLQDIKEQWEYVTALPKDENGLTNPYVGITFEEYETIRLNSLKFHGIVTEFRLKFTKP